MTRSLDLLVLRLGARILLRELQLMDTDARAAAREVSLLLEAALGLAGVFRRNSVSRSFAVSHFHTPSTFEISTLLPLFAQRSPIFHAYFQSRR